MESSYIDMANKISLMLNEKINEQINEPKNNITTVEDTLTELIHMDTITQEGGIAIENLMDNMTGGNAKNNKKNNETNNEEIFNVVKKTINDNYFEGGGKTNGEEESETDGEEESETDGENNTRNNGFDSEEESEDNSENSYASIDYYAEFLKHYNDREFKDMQTNIDGGNNEEQNDKIKIISRFPYMVRY